MTMNVGFYPLLFFGDAKSQVWSKKLLFVLSSLNYSISTQVNVSINFLINVLAYKMSKNCEKISVLTKTQDDLLNVKKPVNNQIIMKSFIDFKIFLEVAN